MKLTLYITFMLIGASPAATVTDSFLGDEYTIDFTPTTTLNSASPTFTATWTGTYGSISQDFIVTGLDRGGNAGEIVHAQAFAGLGVSSTAGLNDYSDNFFAETMTFATTGATRITANSGYSYVSDTLSFSFDNFGFRSVSATYGMYATINGDVYDSTAQLYETGSQDFGSTAVIVASGNFSNNSWSSVQSTTLDVTGDIIFDEVVNIPEPSSATLLGLGGLALLSQRKRA